MTQSKPDPEKTAAATIDDAKSAGGSQAVDKNSAIEGKPGSPGSPDDNVGDAAPAREVGGRDGLDPTRYGDWENKGRCVDF